MAIGNRPKENNPFDEKGSGFQGNVCLVDESVLGKSDWMNNLNRLSIL